MRIGIIGSAGRGEDKNKISGPLYWSAVQAVEDQIDALNPTEKVILVSGGAAFADHIAVSLFNRRDPELILHLPSQFSIKEKTFYGTKDADIANYYHRLFREKTGVKSLVEIANLFGDINVQIFSHSGFFVRNLEVGKVDVLIALTFNNDTVPKDGGTKHTWNHSSAPLKIHISLDSLRV